MSKRGRSIAQTNGGGFGSVVGVAVTANRYLYVADGTNQRVLGFSLDGLTDGDSADIVINQADEFDIDHTNIPDRQNFTPVGVAADGKAMP